jgi:hypothetical protein
MLRSLKALERYAVSATDGEVGHVVDFLLDDQRWAVRYLVVQTGGFFEGRQSLITPISFRTADWETKQFHLALTRERVKHSPSPAADQPVSSQHEREYYRHYGYPYYWGSDGIWGAGDLPTALAAGAWIEPLGVDDAPPGDPHLRSAQEVTGYEIQGSDGAIGHVADFLLDDGTWSVRYLVVDTSNWWFGKKVLVDPSWASGVSWAERKVVLDLSRQAIRDSPEWDSRANVERGYELRLHDHYGRPPYWTKGSGTAPTGPS